MTEETYFKGKVSKYADGRLKIEVTKHYREDFPPGTMVKVVKCN